MKQLINLGLLLTFQFCYLEWPNNTSFVFQAQYEIFSKTHQFARNFLHPIILIGFFSQILILLSVIFKNFNSKWNLIGVIALTPIVLLFLLVGIVSFNIKIIISTIPYLIFLILYFKFRNKKTASFLKQFLNQ